MRKDGAYILLSCFGIQAVLNLVFYGFAPVMFSTIVPGPLFRSAAWALPLLVLGYFLFGIAALYYLSFSLHPLRARVVGGAYFLVGLAGSIAVILESRHDYESPVLFLVFGVWALTSLVGLAFLLSWRNTRIPEPAAAAVITLLGLSALLSAFTAQWIVTDYYVHVEMNESVPENATVITGHPVPVPPPNATNASG